MTGVKRLLLAHIARSIVHSTVLVAAAAVLSVSVPAAQASPVAHATAAAPTGYPDGGGRANADRPPAAGFAPRDVTPPPGYPVTGIDVASWNHPDGAAIDWAALSASGYRFAYVKATENTDYTNPYFAADLHDAKANGMFAGAYVFARPDQPNPAAQADYFYQNMAWAHDGKSLPPFVDIEWPWFTGYDDCYNLTQPQMSAWLHTFLNRLQAHIGRAPLIYTAANWWNECLGSDKSFGRYRLDVSSCQASPTLPNGWTDWTFWQWTIAPCGGPDTDQDVFHGSLRQLALFANDCADGAEDRRTS
jgi:GH25 family lysozyme M1 (1,4-beta-N-acetylmuramidase)